jgi:glucosylceramidase
MKKKSINNLKILIALFSSSLVFGQQNFNLKQKKIEVYSTVKDTKERLSKSSKQYTVQEFNQPKETDPCIFIDPVHTFQNYVGTGGAITDASAETFAKLPKSKQQEIINAYFDKEKGSGYNLLRTTINSSDFSSESYTYVKDYDKELKTFSIAHDLKYKIPMIKEAQKKIDKKEFTFYASPWSPPAWMKDNNNMLKGGSLLPEYYQTWANYFVKFVNAYEKLGMPIWGVSIQNEPMAVQTWESCIYTAEQERDFLKNYLGPTFHKNGFQDKKIIVWDHNRDLIYQRASTILNDPEAAKYVWGVGFHWYETWNGNQNLYDNVGLVHKAFPNVNLIFTEGCKEKFKFEDIYEWYLGEMYGRAMINDFNNGTTAWTDWNILLDETGGPNHVGNFCFAPIIADTRTNEIHYTNAYYYMGHFSRFIRPGAKRIAASSNRSDLLTTSFVNENGKIVVVVMNQASKSMDYSLWIQGQAIKMNAEANSIKSIIIS